MGRIKNLLRNLNYLSKHSLYDQREEDIVYLSNKILSDGYYEYGLLNTDKPLKILSKDESIESLANKPKSLVRLGDGEIKIMCGMDQPFQKYDKELADTLKNILSSDRDDIYVGINRNYFIPLDGVGNDYYRRYAYEFRNEFLKYCNPNKTYLDATLTSIGLQNNGTKLADEHFEKLKKLFDGKNIALVSGEGIVESYKYNIFDNAKDIIKISGPKINAWDKKKELIDKIYNEVPKDYIVVFILGMAGKCMIPELTDNGYLCLDVGHLAKYYDVNKRRVVYSKDMSDKFFAPD